MIEPLFIIPTISLTLLFVFSIYCKTNLSGQSNPKILGTSPMYIIKLITLLSLTINFSYEVYLLLKYPLIETVDNVNYLVYPGNNFFEFYHSLNLPFLLLSTFVLFVALLGSWYVRTKPLLFSSLILITELCLIGAFGCTNIFLFLLFFEASALPIFILIAYCGNPRRERLKASYYFLFFTLYGSISLLLLIINIYVIKQLDWNLDYPTFNSSTNEYVSWLLLFTAFAVKIPLFPVHLWLPYAHVEASTATSIILAALMLKLGGYGMIMFLLPLFSIDVHLYFRPFALLVCVIGSIYGGIAALRQLDLKRQIAFSSIAHMSFATLGIFTFTEAGVKGAIYLMLSHGLTSSMMFYLVGIISDRYHTRSVMAYSGLMGTMPEYTGFMILASLANVGFPGTSGFLPEFWILAAVSTIPSIIIPTLIGMFFTTASTLIALLRMSFGHTKTWVSKSKIVDINKLEKFVLSILSYGILQIGVLDILDIGEHISNLYN